MNNLFLFTGEESYLLRERVNQWKEAFKQKHGDINLLHVDAEEISFGQLRADIEAAPFLGEKRLIFIENLPETSRGDASEKVTKKDEKRDEELKKMAKSLEFIPETSVVVFIQPRPDKRLSFYKTLVKLAKVDEFKLLSGHALNQWVKQKVNHLNGKIESASSEYLISQTGQNCWQLSQEIKKLTSYSEGRNISKEDIDNLVIPTPEANIFHFTDALGGKDHRKAIHHLHKSMAAGENLRQLFYMIVRQFRLLLQVQSHKSLFPTANAASVASSLKLHPFVARNILTQISHFNSDELKIAYERLLEIDHSLKSSQIRITTDNQDELALAIERFILRFCC